MKKCPYCGRDNDDKATVCQNCFASIPHDEPKEDKPVNEEKTRSRRK